MPRGQAETPEAKQRQLAGLQRGGNKKRNECFTAKDIMAAIRNVEKKDRIDYLETIVRRSKKDATLVRIVMDRAAPIPKEQTTPTTIIIKSYIPGMEIEVK